jgi:hypothetical protein
VVAVNDGVVTEIGESKRLGRYVVLRDAYGNRFTYAELGEVADAYPVRKEEPRAARAGSPERAAGDVEAEPTRPASRSNQPAGDTNRGADQPAGESVGGAEQPPEESIGGADPAEGDPAATPVNTEDARPRLAAYPERDVKGGWLQISDPSEEILRRLGYESFRSQHGALEFDPKRMDLRRLDEGSKVVAGTVLGRIGKRDGLAPHLHFAIQPAGRGAPRIDPKPILDGWKLLEATHLYRASGKNPFEAGAATSGQMLLLSKDQATRELLGDPRVSIYECGTQDIRSGQIDSRVMRLLLYLASRGFRLTVTSLKCGHSFYTASGSVSHHSSGNAVDIAEINGLPVLGNQGPGSVTEALVRETMALQGSMAPDQIISLMDLGGATFAMGDHADHVHVGYTPLYGPGSAPASRQFTQILEADQWERLIDRISEIDNPTVPTKPSRYAVRSRNGGDGAASPNHSGE